MILILYDLFLMRHQGRIFSALKTYISELLKCLKFLAKYMAKCFWNEWNLLQAYYEYARIITCIYKAYISSITSEILMKKNFWKYFKQSYLFWYYLNQIVLLHSSWKINFIGEIGPSYIYIKSWGRQADISHNIFLFHATYQLFLSSGSHKPQLYGLPFKSSGNYYVFK